MRRLLQEFVESFRIAFEQIAANRMRSLLTMLGVIIGIVAVTLMGTAIRGIDEGFDRSMDILGDDILYVQTFPWNGGNDWWRYRNRQPIDLRMAEEAREILANTPGSALTLVTPTTSWATSARRGAESVESTFVLGAEAEFALLTTSTFAEGRFFNETEAVTGRSVAVLGHTVAEGLFPEGNPVGKTFVLGNRTFEVIGVFARQGSFLGMFSFDGQVVIPLAALRRMSNWDRGSSIRFKIREGATVQEAVDEVTGLVRRLRGLDPDEEDDFAINRTEAFEAQLGPIKSGIAVGGLFITGLSLLVGAIGIMNITFVSVRERTREIGTRRALGARRRSILTQFLIEAVAVCLVGGIIGVSLALGVAQLVAHLRPDFPIVIEPGLVLVGLGVASTVGILSGFAPALQASRLDPAEALRHE